MRAMKSIILLMTTFIFTANQAYAISTATIPPPGTLATATLPMTQSGKKTGCEIDFSAVVSDHIYKQGSWIHLQGSVILSGYSDKNVSPSLIVKLILNDMISVPGGYEFIPHAPNSVNLVGKKEITNISDLIASTPGEDAGSILAIFRLGKGFEAVLSRIYSDNEIIILFNRNSGGLDVRVPIDLTVQDYHKGIDSRSDKTTIDFAECSKDLFNDLMSNAH